MNLIRLIPGIAALAALAAVPVPAGAQDRGLPQAPESIEPSPFSWQCPAPESLRRVFPKGLVAYMSQDKTASAVSFRIFTGRGSLHDPKAKPGLMHTTCASMISGGTSMWSPSHLARQIDLLGVVLAVDVHPLHTVISAEFPPENTRKVLFLIADIIFSPTFDSNAVEAEKARITQGFVRMAADAEWTACMNHERIAFGLGPVDFASWASGVGSVERKDLKQCHTQAFSAPAIVLSISGDIDEKGVMDILEYKFDMGGQKDKGPEIDAQPSPQDAGVRLLRSKSRAACAAVGRVAQSFPADRQPALDVFGTLVSGPRGRAAAFGKAGSRAARLPMRTLGIEAARGIMYLRVVCPSSDIPLRLRELIDAARRLASEEPAAREFETARKTVESHVQSLFATRSLACDAFASLEVLRLPAGFYSSYLARLGSVTFEEVRAVASAFVAEPGPMITIAGDPDSIADAEIESGIKLSDLGKVTSRKE